MMQYCFGINTIILLSVSQLGTLFASDASFWCYININELYIKKRLYNHFHPVSGMSIASCQEWLTQSKESVTLFIKHHWQLS